MNEADLLITIICTYGCRTYWLSDLARSLGISRKEANILTIAAGYSRGKLNRIVSVAEFMNNPDVRYILNKINVAVTAAKAP